jgi:WhiB family redox-sensing transcriptional regulator
MPSAGHFTSRYTKLLSEIHKHGTVPCEDHPELFYPEDYSDPEIRSASTKAAKALCNTCPIKKECFEYALETNQEFGIWGGTSASER